MIRHKVSIDDKDAIRRISSMERRARKIGHRSTKDVGRWTRDQLILRTPKDTGDTARSIGIIKESHRKDADEVEVGMRYLPYGSRDDANSWKKDSNNLFDFMMNSPMAVTGFYPYGNRGGRLVHFSKDVTKMRSVPLEAADKFRKRVIINTREILK